MNSHIDEILTEQEIALRYAESMKLFERNGKIVYGKWREWMNARTKDEADILLKQFTQTN